MGGHSRTFLGAVLIALLVASTVVVAPAASTQTAPPSGGAGSSTAPSSPEIISVEPDELGGAVIWWQPSESSGAFPDVTYKIYAWPGGLVASPRWVQNPTEPVGYNVGPLPGGIPVRFTIAAVNNGGVSLPTPASEPIQLLGQPIEPTVSVEEIGPPGFANGGRVTWDPAVEVPGVATPSHYYVERLPRASTNTVWATAEEGEALMTVSPGTTARFLVRAQAREDGGPTNRISGQVLSDPVSAPSGAPGLAEAPTVTGTSTYTISWAAPDPIDPRLPVLGYELVRFPAGDLRGPYGAGTTSAQWGAWPAGRDFQLMVRARTATGYGPPSPLAEVTTSGSTTEQPAPPEDLRLLDPAARTVTWDPPTGEDPPDSYRIYRLGPLGTSLQTTTAGTTSTPVAGSGDAPGVGTWVMVSAVVDGIEGLPSAPIQMPLPASQPDTPTGLDAERLPSGEVRVSWDAVDGIGEGHEYFVHRLSTGQPTRADGDPSPLTTVVDGTETSVVVPDPGPGSHTWAVAARRATGSTYIARDMSPPSDPSPPVIVPPPAPLVISCALVGADEVEVSWLPRSGAHRVYSWPGGGEADVPAGQSSVTVASPEPAPDDWAIWVQSDDGLTAGSCSDPSVATSSVTGVSPQVVGSSGPVTFRVRGSGLTGVTAMRLVAPDGSEHSTADVSSSPHGWSVTGRFDLDLDPGTVLDVEVDVPGAGTLRLEDAVDLVAAEPIELRTELRGPTVLRRAVPARFELEVHNDANVDAELAPVFIGGIPADAELTPIFDPLEPPPDLLPGLGNDYEHEEIPITVADQDGSLVAPLFVSSVPANGSVVLPFLLTPQAPDPFSLSTWAGECRDYDVSLGAGSGTDLSSDKCEDAMLEQTFEVLLGLVPGADCAKTLYQQFAVQEVTKAAVSAEYQWLKSQGSGEASWGSWLMAKALDIGVSCVISAVPIANTWKQVAKAAWATGQFEYGLYQAGCFEETPKVEHPIQAVVQAMDPNDKLGPAGVGEERWTRGDVDTSYTVRFENVEDATAAAQTVVVTDHVDPAVFDVDSIELGDIVLGYDTVVAPAEGQRELNTVATSPHSPYPVGVDVAFDESSSELRWTFTTLDPDTLEPTLDPVAGFLPPNETAPEGQGSVSFSVEPIDRSHGTVLANQASIVFDANEPIVTNVWSNTVDETGPASEVAALPATTSDDVEVAWSASDAGSGLAGVQVWVSEDGTPPVQVASVPGDGAGSFTFSGAVGSTYAVFTRAFDRVGLLEPPPSAPDAVTTVVAPPPDCDGDRFSDVDEDHPFCVDITWLVDGEVTNGYTDGTFRPTAAISRQSMAAFLYRYAGSPDGATPTCEADAFPDVPADHPFCGEIAWMIDLGITGGFTDGTFRPTAAISRQSMAAFLYRYAGAPDGPAPSCSTAAFPDVSAAHAFCGEIAWMVEAGITGGFTDGTFRPTAPISRQAMAAFLHRYEDQPAAGEAAAGQIARSRPSQ